MNNTLNRTSAFLVPLIALAGLTVALVAGENTMIELSWVGLGSQMGLDATGRTFLLFTSVLWLLSSIYGLGYLKGDRRRWIYDAFFLSAMLGNFGLIAARDAVTFYTCFALMSFSSFGLVIHNRDEAAIRAGKVYIILVVIGEMALFAALVSMLAGNGINIALPVEPSLVTHPVTVALLIFGFGIKAGVVILHVWLPLAHPAAPPPASAVLSGAMIKAGLLGWLRFLPLGESGFEGWGTLLMVAGLIAAFYGVAIGLVQTNPKAILAYSSISQMGFMTLGVGAGLLHPDLWPALLVAVSVYALHHGLAKGALFLGAGIAPGGMPRLAWLGMVLPALSLAGAPFLSGAAAKSALKTIVPDFSGRWPSALAVLLPLAAMGTAILMIRFIVVLRGFHPTSHRDRDRRYMFTGWALLVLCSLVVCWIWEPASTFALGSLKADKLFKATWPVVAAITLSRVVFHRRSTAMRWLVGRIPPGDLLVFGQRLIGNLPQIKQREYSSQFLSGTLIDRARKAFRMPLKIDTALSRWTTAVLLLLALLMLMITLAS